MAKWTNGAIAGLLATLPMTGIMELLYQKLPSEERYPLPPEEIETRLVEHTILKHNLGEPDHMLVTNISHFGYGTLCGVIYSQISDLLPFPGVISGAVTGFVIWIGSYLGWLPAFGILSPATQHPARRTLLMIAAHLLWGSTTGLLLDRFEGTNPRYGQRTKVV